MIDAGRPNKARLLLFAFGDFAFNLYWQSIMLFLLFYYSDAIGLPIAVAATVYMIASVWDGIANLVAGLVVDRKQSSLRYGAWMVVGAAPLGLSFTLAYLPPALPGMVGIAVVLGGQLIFRTAYAATNVPYLAMTARVSPSPSDRALVAGARMLFGTLAAVIVALGTVPVGKWITGSADAPRTYLVAAMIFALAGTAIMVLVGASYRDCVQIERPPPGNVKAALLSLLRNRAFVTLNGAMVAMIIAVTVLGKSVLYYFKYVLSDPAAGQLALASISAVSAIAIPLWMITARYLGMRTTWFVATGIAMLGLAAFAISGLRTPFGMQMFLIGMQVTIVGMHFAFWAMLPNTIEYGEAETGLHVEGAVFGVAALLQRVGIGIATAILGWTYASAGYVANVTQTGSTLASMRATVAFVPLIFLALSGAAMLFNPLGRNTSLASKPAI